jgi:hypothetical protein
MSGAAMWGRPIKADAEVAARAATTSANAKNVFIAVLHFRSEGDGASALRRRGLTRVSAIPLKRRHAPSFSFGHYAGAIGTRPNLCTGKTWPRGAERAYAISGPIHAQKKAAPMRRRPAPRRGVDRLCPGEGGGLAIPSGRRGRLIGTALLGKYSQTTMATNRLLAHGPSARCADLKPRAASACANADGRQPRIKDGRSSSEPTRHTVRASILGGLTE